MNNIYHICHFWLKASSHLQPTLCPWALHIATWTLLRTSTAAMTSSTSSGGYSRSLPLYRQCRSPRPFVFFFLFFSPFCSLVTVQVREHKKPTMSVRYWKLNILWTPVRGCSESESLKTGIFILCFTSSSSCLNSFS